MIRYRLTQTINFDRPLMWGMEDAGDFESEDSYYAESYLYTRTYWSTRVIILVTTGVQVGF